MATKLKAPEKKEESKFVTADQFSSLVDSVTALAKMIQTQKSSDPETVKLEKAIDKAGPHRQTVNPEWQEKAEEILGTAMDRCELFMPRNGGSIFTVIIKKEKSNAPKEYLEMYKEDRRSKEIGSEGIEGVEQWCKLIKQNLNRAR